MPASTPPVPASAPALSKSQIFFRRLGSTVFLWTIVLTAMFSPNVTVANWVFLLLMLLLAVTGLLEFYGMVEKRGLACFRWFGVGTGALLMAASHVYLTSAGPERLRGGGPNDFEMGFLALAVLGLFGRQFVAKGNPNGFAAIATTLLGLIYVPWLLNFLQKLNYLPGIEGRFYLLFFIVVTKFSDLGAYVTGSLIGRHKMIPRISPGKTWEGFAGAIVIATGTGVLFVRMAGEHMAGLPVIHAVVLGALLSVCAVVGDLIESLFKREAGVKDSGRFFPGIGGILDLLDSLLFNAPLMYLYVRHILRPGE